MPAAPTRTKGSEEGTVLRLGSKVKVHSFAT